LDLVEVSERLENEDVDAAVAQPRHLLAEDPAGLVGTRRSVWLEANSERANRTRDEDDPVAGRFSRQLGGAPIEIVDLRLEPVLRELDPVRAEAVRLDRFGARLEVRLVNRAHEVGCPRVQFIVALVDEDALAVEHRPHRPVEEDDAVGIEQLPDCGRCH
jgi:hypothetical protein